MFLIRQSKPDDASTLHKLARMVFFINLPPDEQIIKGKIEHSVRCFKRVANYGLPMMITTDEALLGYLANVMRQLEGTSSIESRNRVTCHSSRTYVTCCSCFITLCQQFGY